MARLAPVPWKVTPDGSHSTRPRPPAVFVEIFGSPFLRNCSAVIGLLFGYAAAAWSRHGHMKYVPTTIMDQVRPII